MPKQGKERANGPYKHGARWRVVFVSANGASDTYSYATEAEAIKTRDAYNAEAGTRTVSEAVAQFIAQQELKSVETTKFRLYGILRVVEGDRPLTAVTVKEAQRLYDKRVEEVAAGTHHGELKYVKRFFVWCIKMGWIKIHPFLTIEKQGIANRGKPKLRVKATRKYLAALMADDSMEATAVLTTLTFSLRASAVVNRLVRDLDDDDDGCILWVRDNKTKAGDLEIEVPEFLRTRLLKLAAGKGANDRLFGDMTRHGLRYWTVEFCKRAGVDRVTPHGLRGSGATHKVRAGEAIERVAEDIGHADKGITLKNHYLAPGAIESGTARRIEQLVSHAPDDVTNQENLEMN